MHSTTSLIFGIAFLSSAGFLSPSVAEDFFSRVKLGDSVILPCVNESVLEGIDISLSAVTWTHEEKSADEKTIIMLNPAFSFTGDNYLERASLDNETFSLTLSGVAFEDKGAYLCQVITKSGSEQVTDSIEVYASPIVSVRANSLVVQPDETTGNKRLAVCDAEGASPPIEMRWVDLATDEVMTNETSSRTDNPNADNPELIDARLVLKFDASPAKDNERAFACVVIDVAGEEITKNAVLSVTTEPVLVDFPEEKLVSVQIGQSKNIDCEATGIPTPKVAWYKGSNKVTEGMSKATLVVSPDSFDGEMYRCTAKNSAGKASGLIQLQVEGKPTMITENPDNGKSGSLELSHDTEEIILSCVASASPSPEFTWKIEETNSTTTVDDDLTTVTTDGYFSTSTLQLNIQDYLTSIKRVICVAENRLGSDTQEWVAVLNKPPPGTEPSSGGVGWIIGVVLAVLFLLLLIVVIYVLHRKRTSKSEDLAEKGWCASCTCCKQANDGLEGQDNDQIKEVCDEEGSKEEKKKLTAAEEKPDASEDVEVQAQAADDTEEKDNEDDSEANKAAEEVKEKKRRKLKFPFAPSQCCKKSKKQLKEEESVEEEEEAKASQGDDEEQKVLEDDADSGKGDTLEKLVDN